MTDARLVVRAPLRLSLAGGGTDLPEHYLGRGTTLLAAAIDRYVEVATNGGAPPDVPAGSLLRRFAEANAWAAGLTITSDVSPGAGLGGSGALSTCLLALRAVSTQGPRALAETLPIALDAYEWERRAGAVAVGFQDHVAAALGSCVLMGARADGAVWAERRENLARALDAMLGSTLLVVGSTLRRPAAALLDALAGRLRSGDASSDVNALAGPREVEQALLQQDPEHLGVILHRHWEAKKRINPQVTNAAIDGVIDALLDAGASGAKLIGAGAGGHLLVAVPSHCRARVDETLGSAGWALLDVRVAARGVELR